MKLCQIFSTLWVPDDGRDNWRFGVEVGALPLYDDPLGPLCDGLRALYSGMGKFTN